jgi:hypothetical protein
MHRFNYIQGVKYARGGGHICHHLLIIRPSILSAWLYFDETLLRRKATTVVKVEDSEAPE